MSTVRFPTYFLSHGGGPWSYMDGPMRESFAVLEAQLKALPDELPERPKAVLVITGHWEADQLRVSAAEQPGMVYDYFGFPDYTYDIVYPAPGSPELAKRVKTLLDAAGQPTALDDEQGYDHGTFVPLSVMYPEADMPVVMLTMRSDYDPETHLAIGRALAPLRDEGVLIIGSGFSYHNLRLMGPAGKEPSEAFDAWLQKTLIQSSTAERTARLNQWEQAPAARIAHAREDHLVPLFVAVGAAEDDAAECVYHEKDWRGGITASSFRFG
ncbi:MAG: dioxygenase [Natronospirillum sp.]